MGGILKVVGNVMEIMRGGEFGVVREVCDDAENV